MKILTTQELIELRKAADEFAKANLKECCEELVEWERTGLLREGKVKELITMLDYVGCHSPSLAESVVSELAVKLVATSNI